MRAASGRGEKFDVHEKLKYMMEKLAEQGFLNRFQPKRLASKCIQNKPFKKKEQRDYHACSGACYSPWPQTWDPQQQPPPPWFSVPVSREVRHWPAGLGCEDVLIRNYILFVIM